MSKWENLADLKYIYRCEGGVPCSSCKRRGLPCTSADAAAEQDAEQQQSELKYRLDVHVSLYNSTAALLDRSVSLPMDPCPVAMIMTVSEGTST